MQQLLLDYADNFKSLKRYAVLLEYERTEVRRNTPERSTVNDGWIAVAIDTEKNGSELISPSLGKLALQVVLGH
ncbi:MAG: hypothetical protein AAF483_02625 [Planctomycetota bacterium]